MKRIVASMLALAIAFCFSFSAGCGGKETKKAKVAPTSLDLADKGKDGTLTVTDGKIKDAKVDKTDLFDISFDKEKGTVKVTAKAAATGEDQKGEVTITLDAGDPLKVPVKIDKKAKEMTPTEKTPTEKTPTEKTPTK